jgi:uncharacterized membrane protein YraQ (UPF0718 family)
MKESAMPIGMKGHLKNYAWVLLFMLFTIGSYLLGFRPGMVIYSNFTEFFIEMILFIPFLFILIGLFDVWVPKEMIERHIGKESGIKGIFLVILLAMLQAGPLYGAFPVAYLLHKKGASARNIFIYLGAFSTLKLPMLGIEMGYLGWKFTLIRTLVSLPLFIIIGYLLEWIMGEQFDVKDPSRPSKGDAA